MSMTTTFHVDRTLDRWEDDCLWAHVFDGDGCMVAKVVVATRDGTNGGAANTTAEEDAKLGEARLAAVLAGLRT